MAFWSLSALRSVLATETDADSPGSEELLSQLRENWEALTMLVFDTGVSGTVDSVSTATLTDNGNFAGNDVHNGHTLLITSGACIGNMYTIDDTTVNTLVCTGDDLEADGVVATDTYKVLYDLKVNTDGHDHDGVNSKKVVGVADDAIDEAELGTVYRTLFSAWAGLDYSACDFGTTTAAAWETVSTVYVYIPAGVTTIAVYTQAYATVHNDEVYARVSIDAQTCAGATHNDDYTWASAGTVTGMTTGSWRAVNLQMYRDGTSTGYFLGLILVGYG